MHSPATLNGSATMVEMLLPAQGRAALLGKAALVLAATALLTLSAKVQVPFYPVPMTMQTLVVLLIGATFGWRLGSLAILAYLAEGAMGLPVFAGTPGKGIGLAYMMGPTGGYLAGFVAAAMVTGVMAARGLTRSVPGALATMAVGTAVIHLFGLAWLAMLMGGTKAFALGVLPFLAGDVLKAALGAALLPAAWWLIGQARA
jgi:biotin transport system substrate-specific component